MRQFVNITNNNKFEKAVMRQKKVIKYLTFNRNEMHRTPIRTNRG